MSEVDKTEFSWDGHSIPVSVKIMTIDLSDDERLTKWKIDNKN